ncbi:hypothetical protein ABIA27_002606 [Sinorhizobium fredii]
MSPVCEGTTLLCPAGHLPHKGENGQVRAPRFLSYKLNLVARGSSGAWRSLLDLPPVGEMPGRAEGGITSAFPVVAAI